MPAELLISRREDNGRHVEDEIRIPGPISIMGRSSLTRGLPARQSSVSDLGFRTDNGDKRDAIVVIPLNLLIHA